LEAPSAPGNQHVTTAPSAAHSVLRH
jgi:hypothetical protein